jgi:hypothetical protein
VEIRFDFAGVAQLVEQLIRNQQVSGSNPLAGSIELSTIQGARFSLLTALDILTVIWYLPAAAQKPSALKKLIRSQQNSPLFIA